MDPFAESSLQKPSPLSKSHSVKPPGLLQPWLNHEILDARKWFESVGLCAELAGDFVGYDPISAGLFVFSSNKELVENFLQHFMVIRCGRSELIVTLSGAGQTRLIARSGERARIFRNVVAEAPSRLLEIEPTLRENDDIVDLRFLFDDKTDIERTMYLNSDVTLNVGEWLEISAVKFGEGERSPLRVKMDVFRPAP